MRLALTTRTTGPTLDQSRQRHLAAMAPALTKTAFDVRDAIVRAMPEALDRPKPFTLRSLRVMPASPGQLEATVWAMPKQAKYLFWQVEGGTRTSKAFENVAGLHGTEAATPTSAVRLDQYGNTPLGFIRRAMAKGAPGYFVGTPQGGDRPEGVYQRKGSSLVPVMLFHRATHYRGRLDVEGAAQTQAALSWPSQLMRQLERTA